MWYKNRRVGWLSARSDARSTPLANPEDQKNWRLKHESERVFHSHTKCTGSESALGFRGGRHSILIVGYVIAVVVRAGLRAGLLRIGVNRMLSDSVGAPTVNLASIIASVAFWLVLLGTLLGMLNALHLETLSGPFAAMMSQIMEYLPRLLAGGFLLAVAWVIASIVRGVANKALGATRWDDKLVQDAGMAPISDKVGNVLYWLVILLFLPAVLGVLQLNGMLDPVRNMMNSVLDMLPRIFAAAMITLAGWFIAKILRALVSNLPSAAGLDRVSASVGMKNELHLSNLAGVLVCILVFIPVLISALDTLDITAISAPATDMLRMMMLAVPNIFAAGLILFITWYVARFAAGLIASLLANLGFNSLPQHLGIAHMFSDKLQATDLVARVVVFFSMLFATVEAANRLDFVEVRALTSKFIEFGGDILLGVVILLVGFWLAGLAARAVKRISENVMLAGIVRFSILGLVLAMGLSAMGISGQIVDMAFGLVLGAVAVAVALSFGLGGREAAGRQMEYWLSRLRK